MFGGVKVSFVLMWFQTLGVLFIEGVHFKPVLFCCWLIVSVNSSSYCFYVGVCQRQRDLSTMPVLPLDELQLRETDPKTGKLRTLPALVSCVVF